MLQVSINYRGKFSCNGTYRIPALKGVSVNYSGNSLCDERTYQPYMEHQRTTDKSSYDDERMY